MSNEQEQVKLSRETAGQPSEISEARRRWVKGGLWTAPVLLTLPRVSSATTSNGQGLETVSVTIADTVNPASTPYMTTTRNTYRIMEDAAPNTLKTIVNAAASPASSSTWNAIDDWTAFTSGTANNPSTIVGWTLQAPAPYDTAVLVAQLDSCANVIGYGYDPSGTITTATGSAWTSLAGNLAGCP
jgi:hypothetical protein